MSAAAGPSGGLDDQVILEARDIKKHFPVSKGLLISKVTGWIKAVDGVSFKVHTGETLSEIAGRYKIKLTQLRDLNGIEGSRILVNNCGSKDGLEGDFIRVACRTVEDNDRLVEALMRIAKSTESGKIDAAQAR